MNGLNNLVYQLTQNVTLLSKILSDPSLLETYASLRREEIDAVIEVVSDKPVMEQLQNLSPQSTKGISWSRPWVGV